MSLLVYYRGATVPMPLNQIQNKNRERRGAKWERYLNIHEARKGVNMLKQRRLPKTIHEDPILDKLPNLKKKFEQVGILSEKDGQTFEFHFYVPIVEYSSTVIRAKSLGAAISTLRRKYNISKYIKSKYIPNLDDKDFFIELASVSKNNSPYTGMSHWKKMEYGIGQIPNYVLNQAESLYPLFESDGTVPDELKEPRK